MQTTTTKTSKLKALLTGAGFLMISTVLVNAGNYAINLILGRWLGPAVFAEANILATMVMMLSFIAVGLQLTVAKYAATYFAQNQKENIENLIAHFVKTGKKIGLYSLPILLLLTPFIQSYVRFESIFPLLILFLGVPMYILMSISRGYYQGTNQFTQLAYSYLIEMVVRLAVTLGLILAFYNYDINSELVAIGFLMAFVITYFFTRLQVNAHSVANLPQKEILNFMGVIGIYELSQILINNSDVILVKHFFDAESAGLYAAVALVGRVVFFATWTIVTLLFPKVIEKEKRGEDHSKLFWGALALVASVGLFITSLCFFFDEQVISIIYGEAYIASSHLLWTYALATCCFACANVFAYYHMSLNNYIPVFISISIGILQIISIYFIHGSLEMVIWTQIALMGLLLSSMITYHIYVNMQFSKSLAF